MTRKDGGTAFPMQDPQAIHACAQAANEAAKHDNVEDRDQTYIAARAEAVGGMSLRDYFAAKAMQGMLAVPDDQRYGDRADKALTVEQWQQWCVTGVVEHAYRVADAMLAARSA